MRRLTFAGYLRRYVRSLSGKETNSIFKLAKEAESNFRLREPLFLYALSVGKEDILSRAVKSNTLSAKYIEMVEKYSWDKIQNALKENDKQLDINYHKAYQSFVSRRNMPQSNNDTKVLMHKKIKALQVRNNVSNYRLYTDLKLNPSNINAFLKHGEVRKVSIDVARNIISYLEAT